MFPPTFQRVERNSRSAILEKVSEEIEQVMETYRSKNELEIENRIKELEKEWDTERVLEANFAAVVLLSTILATIHHKKWLILTGTASVFLMQHAFQGWCLPLPLIQRLGIRTTSQIFREKHALVHLLEEKRLNW